MRNKMSDKHAEDTRAHQTHTAKVREPYRHRKLVKQKRKREMATSTHQPTVQGDVDGDQEKTQREFPVPTRTIPVSGDTPWHLFPRTL